MGRPNVDVIVSGPKKEKTTVKNLQELTDEVDEINNAVSNLNDAIHLNGEERPLLTDKDTGRCFFDTTLNKPIWWTGTKWVDATGTEV